MTIRVDGKIDRVESLALKTVVILTHAYNGPSPQGSVPPGVKGTFEVLDQQMGGGFTIPAPAVSSLYQEMQTAYAKINAIADIPKNQVVRKHLQMFRDVMADVEVAMKQGKGLQIDDPKLMAQHKPDLSSQVGLIKLVQRFLGEKPAKLFKGKIVDYSDKGKRDQLVVVYLDTDHTNPGLQKKIRDGLMALKSVKLSGSEGFHNELDFNRLFRHDPNWSISLGSVVGGATVKIYAKQCIENAAQYMAALDQQNIPLAASMAVECMLGQALFTQGLEKDDFIRTGQALQDLKAQIKQGNPLTRLEYYSRYYARSSERGTYATNKLADTMNSRAEKTASLVYGYAHYHEIKAALDQRGLNYIVVLP